MPTADVPLGHVLGPFTLSLHPPSLAHRRTGAACAGWSPRPSVWIWGSWDTPAGRNASNVTCHRAETKCLSRARALVLQAPSPEAPACVCTCPCTDVPCPQKRVFILFAHTPCRPIGAGFLPFAVGFVTLAAPVSACVCVRTLTHTLVNSVCVVSRFLLFPAASLPPHEAPLRAASRRSVLRTGVRGSAPQQRDRQGHCACRRAGRTNPKAGRAAAQPLAARVEPGSAAARWTNPSSRGSSQIWSLRRLAGHRPVWGS